MTSRRPLAIAVAAAATVAPAAAAQTPPPTLSFDRTCYTEQQSMWFAGSGFTPGGTVNLLLTRPGTVLGSIDAVADATGNIADSVQAATEDEVLAEGEEREERFVTANDKTRIEQNAEPQAQFATASFTFTRWEGFSPGRYATGQKAWAEIYGWAFAVDSPAYFLFRKGSHTAASVRLGTIAGPCGDLKARFTVPRKLRKGAYKVFLSTTAARPSGRGTWRSAHVVRGGASPRRSIARATAGASTRMNRAR